MFLVEAGVGKVEWIFDFHWADLLGPMLEVRAGVHLPSGLNSLWFEALGEFVNQFIQPAVQGDIGQALHLTHDIGKLCMSDPLVRDVPVGLPLVKVLISLALLLLFP